MIVDLQPRGPAPSQTSSAASASRAFVRDASAASPGLEVAPPATDVLPDALSVSLARSVRQRANATAGRRGSPLQRYYRMDPSAKTYPEGWRDNEDDRSSGTKADRTETFFIRQERVNRGYFDAEGRLPNIATSARPPLLVSDDRKMAIEESLNGAEAKNFFASTDLVDQANQALTGAVRLRTTNRHLVLGQNALYEVEPIMAVGSDRPRSGLDIRTPQKCNLMAGFLTNIGSLQAPPGDQLVFRLAAAIDTVTGLWYYPATKTNLHSELAAAYASSKHGGGAKAYWAKQTEVENRFYEMADGLLGGFLSDALDEAGRGLVPQLGKAIVVWSAGSPAHFKKAADAGIRPFPYHFATVVATSGADYVTLENYERREKSATDDTNDPLFFFQMYSTSTARPEQSWQHRQAASPGIIGVPVSFQWREGSDYTGL